MRRRGRRRVGAPRRGRCCPGAVTHDGSGDVPGVTASHQIGAIPLGRLAWLLPAEWGSDPTDEIDARSRY